MARRPREREKPCARCEQVAAILYRVQIAAGDEWIFVCRRCWESVAVGNPEYRYGGTWKAHKRSR